MPLSLVRRVAALAAVGLFALTLAGCGASRSLSDGGSRGVHPTVARASAEPPSLRTGDEFDADPGFAIAPRPARGQVGRYQVGRPYTINGRTYTPEEDWTYRERGGASWYGAEFAGRPTANGEIFDPDEITAAHKTLPLPSVVQVTNLRNGRALMVRVNDRGPFVDGRIIDLSRRAAELLGFRDAGTTDVEVRVLAEPTALAVAEARGGEVPAGLVTLAAADSIDGIEEAITLSQATPPTLPLSPAERATWYVQAGAFADFANAEALTAQLRPLGRAAIEPTVVDGAPLYRVRLGPVRSTQEANELVAQMVAAGVPEARIVAD